MIRTLRSMNLGQEQDGEDELGAPRISVVFTSLSRKSKKTEALFQKMIQDYKVLLCEEMAQQYGIINDKVQVLQLKRRLDNVLPDGNFYCYNFDEDEDDEFDISN